MDRFRRILVPVYFDEVSPAAIDYGAYFARQNGGAVILLHVVPTDEFHLLRPFYRPHAGGGADVEWAERTSRETLEELRAERLSGVDCEVVVSHHADPARGILEQEDRQSADLVVMATHARAGLSRLVMRSVAERVVRESRLPVFVTQRKVEVPKTQPFRSILCPIDLDPRHLAALDHARGIALANDATVHLLHVVPTEDIFLARDIYHPEGPETPSLLRAEAVARRRIAEIAEERLPGVRCETRVHVSPEPARTILEIERDLKVDLLVMQTQGFTGLVHLVVGSLTERMIRRAYCPVLAVHGR